MRDEDNLPVFLDDMVIKSTLVSTHSEYFTYRIRPLSQVCQSPKQVLRMIAYSVLGYRAPEMHNISIIPKSENTSVGNIISQKISRPMDPRLIIKPSVVGTACDAMDKNDTNE